MFVAVDFGFVVLSWEFVATAFVRFVGVFDIQFVGFVAVGIAFEDCFVARIAFVDCFEVDIAFAGCFVARIAFVGCFGADIAFAGFFVVDIVVVVLVGIVGGDFG